MNGRVAIGGVKIDDSVSYYVAAYWAGVIDNEVQCHVGSLSLWANGVPSRGAGSSEVCTRVSAKIYEKGLKIKGYLSCRRTVACI